MDIRLDVNSCASPEASAGWYCNEGRSAVNELLIMLTSARRHSSFVIRLIDRRKECIVGQTKTAGEEQVSSSPDGLRQIQETPHPQITIRDVAPKYRTDSQSISL